MHPYMAQFKCISKTLAGRPILQDLQAGPQTVWNTKSLPTLANNRAQILYQRTCTWNIMPIGTWLMQRTCVMYTGTFSIEEDCPCWRGRIPIEREGFCSQHSWSPGLLIYESATAKAAVLGESKEAAIALAITSVQASLILSDLKTAIRNFADGRSTLLLRTIVVKFPSLNRQIQKICISAHSPHLRNEAA